VPQQVILRFEGDPSPEEVRRRALSYEVDCWTMIGGCGGRHLLKEVEVVAVDGWLACDYREEDRGLFKLFVESLGLEGLPERPPRRGG
jgi:hypothetical protein